MFMEKDGKSKRRRFSAEFKAQAVARVLDEGRSVAEVARELGIYDSSLGKWVKQAKVDRGQGPEGALTTEEKKELVALRRENRRLREEREILEKATAFFASRKK